MKLLRLSITINYTKDALQLQSRAVWHLIAGHDSVDYSLSGSAMELSSFEFGLRLFFSQSIQEQ